MTFFIDYSSGRESKEKKISGDTELISVNVRTLIGESLDNDDNESVDSEDTVSESDDCRKLNIKKSADRGKQRNTQNLRGNANKGEWM